MGGSKKGSGGTWEASGEGWKAYKSMSEAPEQSAREGSLTVMTEFCFEGSGHNDFRRGLEATRRAQQAPWRQVPEYLLGVFGAIILRNLLSTVCAGGLRREYIQDLEAAFQLNITGLRQGYAPHTYTLKAIFEP